MAPPTAILVDLAKQPDPRGRASAALKTCFRCGQTGHMSAEWSGFPDRLPIHLQRDLQLRSLWNLWLLVWKLGWSYSRTSMGHERVDCTMLDPGASAFLCGYGPLRRYLQHLGELGYPLDKIEFVKCCRTFHFGGDAASLSSWTVKLPVFINQQVGRIQAYLVKGETPMLLGRPIMESLGLLMDFHGQQSW